MYSVKGKQAARIEPVTFSELSMTENDRQTEGRFGVGPKANTKKGQIKPEFFKR